MNKQETVELDDDTSDDPRDHPSDPAQHADRHVLPQKVRRDVDQGERRTHARAAIEDLEPRTLEKAAMAGKREVLKVVRISVKNLQKGGRGENVSTGLQNSQHLSNGASRILEVLENCLAMDRADACGRKRQMVCITDDVHVRKQSEIQIPEARMSAQRPASDRDPRTRTVADHRLQSRLGPGAAGWSHVREPGGERARASILAREPLE